MLTEELANGEIVLLDALEILSIPDASIVEVSNDSTPQKSQTLDTRYTANFAVLLSELYQSYKVGQTSISDLSFEILWKTVSVKNQSYNANIKLYIILRCIGTNLADASTDIQEFKNIFSNALNHMKYEFKDMEENLLRNLYANISTSSIRALVKDERIENLQNQVINVCYAYDKISQSEQDLGKISNCLIDYPNSALSIQLIPSAYTPAELDAIEKNTNFLDNLNKGVNIGGNGNVGFVLAEKCSEIYKYYSNKKSSSLFLYNITVWGDRNAVNTISSKVYGQINSNQSNQTAIKFLDLSDYDIVLERDLFSLPWLLNEILLESDRNPQIWNIQGSPFASFYRLPYIITAEEATELFRLPIGSEFVAAGLDVNSSSKKNRTYASSIINGGDITVGKLRSSSRNDTIGFFLKDLTKHMLVVGTPGSGKTTFSVSLLDRLWKEHKIPFLVIEPAKNEYRALVQSIPDIQVFTPGKNYISPFVFNPFYPPKNVALETYKSTLKTAFAAGVTMTSPLDKIFEESINNCYSDFRWLNHYTSDDKGRIFNISDFIKCFKETFDSIGYTGDARNIGRAGTVRLAGLINLFDNYYSVPIEDILSKPTIIELSAIENSDQKALIIALLLLSILAYVNRNFLGEGNLRNVILLEEAHVLLDSESGGSEGAADPSAIAKGLLKRMLAEIRSYGVGIVIADQSPRKVSSDVVALTNIKLSFRLVEASDKEILANSTNMSDAQISRLSKLKPGEAFLFFDKLEEPEEVITPDYRADNNISISLTDEGISDNSTYWNDKAELLRPYPECSYGNHCKHSCDFACRNLGKELSRRIMRSNFKSETSDFSILKNVFSNLRSLAKAELNDEVLTDRIYYCTKVNFLRDIKYNTKIKLSDNVIKATLQK